MNEAQKATLTEEQREWLEWAAGEVVAHRDWADRTVLALAALADARLEVARLTEERDRFQREAARPCWGEDEQGVSRPHAELLDRQREDIRRLVEELGEWGDNFVGQKGEA